MKPDDELPPELHNPYASPRTAPEDSTELGPEDVSLVGVNPFMSIWTRPRDTVRRLVANDPRRHVVLLVCLSGVGEALDRASLRSAGDNLPLAAILVLACFFGPLSGLFSLWIGSHLIRWTGSWIGGTATREHVRTAIAWASVPSVFALPLWIPELLLFGSELFTTRTPRLDSQPGLLIPFFALGFVELVLGVWGFVLSCNTIAEVQGFRSAWRGFGNILLAGTVIVVPLLILAFGLAALILSVG